MNFKDNRIAGYLIILAVYFIAAIVGIVVYLNLHFAVWLKLMLADIAATLFVYLFSAIFRNASVYDPYWSVAPAIVVTAFSIYAGPLSPIKIGLIIIVALWSLRLTVNWAYTFKGMGHQDWRYIMLKEKTGGVYQLVNLFGIHLFPTLVVYLCIVPAVYLINFGAEVSLAAMIIAFFGLGISLLGIALESISDFELHHFKFLKKPGFIRVGLWKHARHPNYLGEILMWWGIAIACCVVLNRWYFLAGAVVNTLMFLVVSIPMADEHQASKPGFEKYKDETNSLLPIKIKK